MDNEGVAGSLWSRRGKEPPGGPENRAEQIKKRRNERRRERTWQGQVRYLDERPWQPVFADCSGSRYPTSVPLTFIPARVFRSAICHPHRIGRLVRMKDTHTKRIGDRQSIGDTYRRRERYTAYLMLRLAAGCVQQTTVVHI